MNSWIFFLSTRTLCTLGDLYLLAQVNYLSCYQNYFMHWSSFGVTPNARFPLTVCWSKWCQRCGSSLFPQIKLFYTNNVHLERWLFLLKPNEVTAGVRLDLWWHGMFPVFQSLGQVDPRRAVSTKLLSSSSESTWSGCKPRLWGSHQELEQINAFYMISNVVSMYSATSE